MHFNCFLKIINWLLNDGKLPQLTGWTSFAAAAAFAGLAGVAVGRVAQGPVPFLIWQTRCASLHGQRTAEIYLAERPWQQLHCERPWTRRKHKPQAPNCRLVLATPAECWALWYGGERTLASCSSSVVLIMVLGAFFFFFWFWIFIINII